MLAPMWGKNSFAEKVLLTVVQVMLHFLYPAVVSLIECTLCSSVAFHSPFDMSALHWSQQ